MRVCVIGAGSAGLTTAKHLLEEGFEVEILEKTGHIGGLWFFTKDESGVSTHTYATSSKTFLQFSDFPFEPDVPHFPHHTEYIKYLNTYIAEHNLQDLIKFNHEVLHAGKKGSVWEIKIQNGDEIYTDTFDAVAVCSGLHHVPLMPEIPGADQFKGQVIHSSFLKEGTELTGKRVIVVGGGESAADAVHELAPIADKVYLSLKRGIAVARSWSPYKGLPGDFDSTRAKVWLPREYLHDYNVSCRLSDQYSAFKTIYTLIGLPFFLVMLATSYKKAVNIIRSLFDLNMWLALFKPTQRFGPASGVELSKACEEFCKEIPESQEEIADKAWHLKYILDWYSGTMHNSQPFTKRIAFLEDVVKGQAKIMPAIARYHEGFGVEFDGGTKVEADAVVMCTGFHSILPFLDLKKLDGRTIYKNVFLSEDPTLGFVGFIRPNIGSLPAAAEMQARLFVGALAGNVKLPNPEQMRKEIEMDADMYTTTRPHHVNRATSLIDYHVYMEELARIVGCRPNLWQLIFRPNLLFKLLFGPMGCFQYRLTGYGAKPEIAMKMLEEIPAIPFDRVLQHTILYFIMKPWFVLLSKFGIRKFRPVF
jgi:cation diffusion facilitator CzcD-associated flavoprotein CzcO